jgi:hypothetical protein
MRTDDPHSCRWCGDPLPAREPGKPGRPRVSHAGTCARLYGNRQKWTYRRDRYLAAVRPDRSDERPVDGYGIDADDLAEGWSVDDPQSGPGLARRVEAWETAQRLRKALRAIEWEEERAEREAALAALATLPEAQRDELVRRAVARRLARAAF